MKTTQVNTVNPLYLTGFADVKLKEAETLDTVCSSIIPNYNVERFEAIAIRGFLGKETTVTVYAIDKLHKSGGNGIENEKMAVKKFKIQIPLDELIALFSNINFTISTGNVDLEDMEIINK